MQQNLNLNLDLTRIKSLSLLVHSLFSVNELELHVRGHTHVSSVSLVRSHLFTLITWTDLGVDGCVSEETCLSRVPNMKKQVKFAESQTIHRLYQDEAPLR